MSVCGLSTISVYFKHDCEKSNCTCRPISSLCAVSVTIPMHCDTLEKLTNAFDDCIIYSRAYGFGLH